jgi:predicted nucleic acid-binding protein
MAVIDASVIVALLLNDEHAPWALAQLPATGGGRALWAPHLIDAEVGQALRREAAAGRLGRDAAGEALLDLGRMPLRRIDHVGLLHRAWELRHNVSFYDSLYVALAELLEAPLLTLDRRLARAAGDATAVTVLAPA